MIQATPIILDNYIDGVIMRKKVFLAVCKENSEEKLPDEKYIEKYLESGRLLDVYGDYVIVNRRFYDISKLIGQYF